MRLRDFIGVATLVAIFIAFAACADDGEEAAVEAPPEADADTRVPAPDDAAFVDAADGDADASRELACSEAGWCETALPDPSASFFAVAPHEDSAFALGWVGGRTTLLEFDGAKWTAVPYDAWDLTPKGEQILFALASPGRDEVWVGGAVGLLVRGVRTSGAWSFEKQELGASDVVRSIYVGTGAAYVATDSRLYRRGGEAGAGFQIDYAYEQDDPAMPTSFQHVVGTADDDVWLLGHRQQNCAFVAHKAGGSWTKVYDSVSFEGVCFENLPYAWFVPFTAPLATNRNELVAVALRESLVRLRFDPNDALVVEQVPSPPDTNAVWIEPGTNAVLTAGFGTVRRAANPWDGGAFSFSTVALDSKPTLTWFEALRGTGPSNLWAVGGSYALHKTAP